VNNLHRELAPISAAAWDGIDAEARRTFTRHLAGRRVVEVTGPAGPELAAVGTGHRRASEPLADGVTLQVRQAQPIAELYVPFTVSREVVDDVERGAKDSDWQPVQDAARAIAFAEDRAVFDGLDSAAITGIRAASSNPALTLPAEPREYPAAVSEALAALRLAGVGGPYSLLLGADAYTAATGMADYGYPIDQHLARLVGSEVIWAPAITGGIVLSARGGDYEMQLGQDLSVGYDSHDATSVQLYFRESLTFLVYTEEAAVTLGAAPARKAAAK
jgi:uncharacterized linocin/CFP29 family protein